MVRQSRPVRRADHAGDPDLARQTYEVGHPMLDAAQRAARRRRSSWSPPTAGWRARTTPTSCARRRSSLPRCEAAGREPKLFLVRPQGHLATSASASGPSRRRGRGFSETPVLRGRASGRRTPSSRPYVGRGRRDPPGVYTEFAYGRSRSGRSAAASCRCVVEEADASVDGPLPRYEFEPSPETDPRRPAPRYVEARVYSAHVRERGVRAGGPAARDERGHRQRRGV